MNRIYLDNAASTPLLPEVKELLIESLDWDLGNPSAIHHFGRSQRSKIEKARASVAKSLNASIGEVFFTSGGTESNNTALVSAVNCLGIEQIISSPIEHPSVSNTLKQIEKTNKTIISLLNVDSYGRVDINQLEDLLKKSDKKTLVSLMHANNEIGSMINLKLVSEICKAHGALFHSDTVQTMGHIPLDMQECELSFMSGSAHKFHGPKGCGILYCNQNNIVESFIKGGSQERNMRAGTESVANILATAKALEFMNREMEVNKNHILKIRTHLKSGLKSVFPEVEFNGVQDGDFLFTVLSTSLPESDKNDMLIPLLDIEGIAVAGSSACSSGAEKKSKVISTIKPDSKKKAIRFSFSHYNTIEEMDHTISVLAKVLT